MAIRGARKEFLKFLLCLGSLQILIGSLNVYVKCEVPRDLVRMLQEQASDSLNDR